MESQASRSDHDAIRRSSRGFISKKYFEIEGTSYAYIVTRGGPTPPHLEILLKERLGPLHHVTIH